MQQQDEGKAGEAAAFAETMRTECLGTRVSRLHRVVARRYDEALRPLGLSIPQLEILSYLVLAGAPSRPSDLAAALLADRSTVSRNLLALQRRGWVRSVSTSATGRSMAVTATDDGATALAAARTAWTPIQTTIAAQIGDRAAGALDTWLTALT